METRIVVEELCEHGEWEEHNYFRPDPQRPYHLEPSCPGGTRRILDPGEYVLVERDTEWSYDDVNRVAWIVHTVLDDKLNRKITWGDAMAILNRLTEGPDPENPHLPAGWAMDTLAGGEQP